MAAALAVCASGTWYTPCCRMASDEGAKTDMPVVGKNPTTLKDLFVYYGCLAFIFGYLLDFFGVNTILQGVFDVVGLKDERCGYICWTAV